MFAEDTLNESDEVSTLLNVRLPRFSRLIIRCLAFPILSVSLDTLKAFFRFSLDFRMVPAVSSGDFKLGISPLFLDSGDKSSFNRHCCRNAI